MNTVVNVHLKGQSNPFRVHDDAYAALQSYLADARARVGAESDADEVVEDLERSIGEKLAVAAGPSDRIIEAADVASALAAVGAVEVGGSPRPSASADVRRRKRRLFRIKEGQQLTGVCQGIALYADVGVDWVRTLFLAFAVVTAGVGLVVYLALAFVLPILPTKAAWFAEMEAASRPGAA